MRLGRERPRKRCGRKRGTAAPARFNEAGARTPQKVSPRTGPPQMRAMLQ